MTSQKNRPLPDGACSDSLPAGTTFDMGDLIKTEVEVLTDPDEHGRQKWRARQLPADWHPFEGPARHVMALLPSPGGNLR